MHLSPLWVKWQLQINHSHVKVNTGKKAKTENWNPYLLKHFITQEYTNTEHNFKTQVFLKNIYWTTVPVLPTVLTNLGNKNSHHFCHNFFGTKFNYKQYQLFYTYAFNIYNKPSIHDIKLHIISPFKFFYTSLFSQI